MPQVVILIFASGKIVIAGAKSREHVNTAFDEILPVLLGYRKENKQNFTRQMQTK
jgi:transcription initiation factor TFIID TATA-box-binding protein